jgi:dihydrolipoamide dehydrogenase
MACEAPALPRLLLGRTTMPEDTYDLVVLGGGSGGYACALRGAELGKRVALVDRDDRLGGTCLLRGCVPTKAFLESAAVMDHVRNSQDWGIQATGAVDWSGVKGFAEAIVAKKVAGLTGLIKTRGIDVVRGDGRLAAGPAVRVDGRTLTATDVVVATGSHPRLLPGMETGPRVITSDHVFGLDSLPGSIVIIGSGAVGVEFASMFRSFGAEVTVLEALPRLVPLEDEDLSKELARALRKRGIQALAGVNVQHVRDSSDRVEVTYEGAAGATTVSAELCLVAVGRGPNTKDIELEEAGVELDRSYVKVDGSLQTTVPHVWAVGDVAATPLQFAHSAFAEGMAVAERVAGLDPPEIDYAGVPRVTFSRPEISSVGLTETQAVERGLEVRTQTFNFQVLAKANIAGEGGICKIVAEPGGGPVLGVHMIGPHVTELISEAMLITNWEASAEDVAALIHPHPTLSEAMGEAFLALAGKPLHSP